MHSGVGFGTSSLMCIMDNITLLTVISSVLVLILTAIYWRVRKAYDFFAKRDIPGPYPAFPLGTWNFHSRHFLGKEDERNIEKFGTIVGTYDGTTPNLLVCDNELVKSVTGDRSKFRSQRAVNAKNPTLKKVLQIIDDEEPKDLSAVLYNANKRINNLLPQIISAANEFVSTVLDARNNGIVVVNSLIEEFIDTVTAKTVLGIDLNEDPVFRQRFVKQRKNLLAGNNATSPLAAIQFIYGGSDSATFSRSSLEYLKGVIATKIKDTNENRGTPLSLVDILITTAAEEKKAALKEKAQEEDQKPEENLQLTESAITDIVLATVVTVMHYTKTSLLFSIHGLANNTQAQEKLALEAEQDVTLDNLKYLNAFAKEVARKYPLEFRLEKILAEDLSLSEGQNLPANTKISIPVFVLHTSKQFHTDPETFSPERFLSENYEKQHPFLSMPTGWTIPKRLMDLVYKTLLLKISSALIFTSAMNDDDIFQEGLTGFPLPKEIVVSVEARA